MLICFGKEWHIYYDTGALRTTDRRSCRYGRGRRRFACYLSDSYDIFGTSERAGTKSRFFHLCRHCSATASSKTFAKPLWHFIDTHHERYFGSRSVFIACQSRIAATSALLFWRISDRYRLLYVISPQKAKISVNLFLQAALIFSCVLYNTTF